MWFYNKVIVRKHERGLLFRDGDFQSFLVPGTYRYISLNAGYRVELYDISQPAFSHELVNYLLESEREQVDQMFSVVEVGADEAAVVFFNGVAAALLGPCERAMYWAGIVGIEVRKVDLRVGLKVDSDLYRLLHKANNAALRAQMDSAIFAITVPQGQTGLLSVDGEFVETIGVGLHAYWRYQRDVRVELADLRVRTLEVQGQEILTRDKVTLRLNVTASWQFGDVALAVASLKDPLDHFYKEVQFALRAAVGTRTLDALLEDKSAIDGEVASVLVDRLGGYGIDVKSVGVKDIILPGEMRELLGQVVEAEKAAQANVIRRREETNATRSLLNTAKVMESNAVALRLKELETLERVTEKVGSLSVYGGLDGVMNELVRLKQ